MNMTTKQILTFFVILFGVLPTSLAQNKKHLVEVSSSANYGLNIFDAGTITNSSFEYRISYTNIRSRFSYTYLLRNRFGLGVSFSHQRFNSFAPLSMLFLDNSNFAISDYETLTFDMIAPMITVTYGPTNSLLPFGIQHTWGIGPSSYRLVDKAYMVEYVETNSGIPFTRETLEVTPNDIYKDYHSYRGVNILYNLDLNIPIATNHFISLGLDFRGNFVRPSNKGSIENEIYEDLDVELDKEDEIALNYFLENRDRELRNRLILSIVWFKVGYKFTL